MRQATDRCPGTLRLHEAADGLLARVRLPGGYLTRTQAAALGSVADDLGCGTVELTSRANVQLRGLRSDGAGTSSAALADRLARRLAGAGLLPSPAHDRVRNIVASPLAGDLRELVAELDFALLARPGLADLPGKFLFGVEGGDGEALALGPDLAIDVDGNADQAPDGTKGRTRSGTEEAFVHAAGLALAVPRAEAVSLVMEIAEVFVRARSQAPVPDAVWRLPELPGSAALVAATAARLGIRPRASDPTAGASRWRSDSDRESPPVVHVPLGELTSGVLGELVDHAPSGVVQLTPWRAVVLRGVTDRPALQRWAAGAGLDASDDSPWRWVSACSGKPRCAKALADVRADARASVGSTFPGTSQGTFRRSGSGQARLGEGDSGDGGSEEVAEMAETARVPVRWSGCERRCGRPAGDVLDVVATRDGYRSELVTA